MKIEKQKRLKSSGIISKILNDFRVWRNRPRPRSLYIVKGGEYFGSALVFFHSEEDLMAHENFRVLKINQAQSSSMELLEIPPKDVLRGIEHRIIQRVSTIPKPIYNILSLDYMARVANHTK